MKETELEIRSLWIKVSLLQHTTLFPLKIIIFLCKVCSFQNIFISIFSFEPHKSGQTATQKKAMRPLGLDEVKG